MEKKFEWLTEDICHEYLERAKKLPPNNAQDTGAWRDLRIELQKRCNLTEVQAYNIIHGYHIKDYLHMYDILSGRIPMPEGMKSKAENSGKKKSMKDRLREYEAKVEELESFVNDSRYSESDYGFDEKE